MIYFVVSFKHSGCLYGGLKILIEETAEVKKVSLWADYRAEFNAQDEATEFYQKVRVFRNILSMSLVKEEVLIQE